MKRDDAKGRLRHKPYSPWLRGTMVVALLATNLGVAQTATVEVVPDAGCFIRSLAPTNNYGAGGALSVSGTAAANGSGVQNGLFDTIMRFPMSNAEATLDVALGGQDWVITEVRLLVTETAAPDNAIFNRGVGAFEVRWVASDEWTEGTGTPKTPTSDGVAWQDLPLILNSNLDVSLGVFTNSGANGQDSFSLGLAERFLADLRQGGEMSLYLTAWSPQIGFTFNSKEFGNTNARPMLVLTAAANPRPRIDAISFTGTNVSVSFGTVLNWGYRLQCAIAQPPGVAGTVSWSDLLTIPPQPSASNVVYLDGVTNGWRLYRLSVSP